MALTNTRIVAVVGHASRAIRSSSGASQNTTIVPASPWTTSSRDTSPATTPPVRRGLDKVVIDRSNARRMDPGSQESRGRRQGPRMLPDHRFGRPSSGFDLS